MPGLRGQMQDAVVPVTSRRLSAASWSLLLLLAFSIFINLLDRGNLSIAAPSLKDGLHLSDRQLGILLSSFAWTLTACTLPAGWMVDRFNVNWILGLGFLFWCATTALSGFVNGFTTLLSMRLLLGVAESVANPAYGRILARHFPEHQRGMANAVMVVAQSAGMASAMFVGGMAVSKFGWRPFFVFLGVAGLPWLLGWRRWSPPDKTPAADEPPLSVTRALAVVREASAWGTGLGLFFGNYVLYLLITWLPFYLVRERHLTLSLAGEIAGTAFVLKAAGALLSGRLSDHLISLGASTTLVRKSFLCLGLGLSGSFLVASAYSSHSYIFLLLLSSAALGLQSPHAYAVSQSLAGPRVAGVWTSFQQFVGSFGSVLAPLVTGFIVQAWGDFLGAFLIAGGACLAGIFCWLFLVGSVRPITIRLAVTAPAGVANCHD